MITVKRGNVVVVDFSAVNPKGGLRPALVILNDRDNAHMTNTILAQITSNVSRAGEDTQILIDPKHPDWSASGLQRPSVINCSNVYTVHKRHINRVIGTLSAAIMQEVNECLKAALAIP